MAKTIHLGSDSPVLTHGHPEPALLRTVVMDSAPFVFISLDCIHYIAGDKITGEVLLNLPEDFPGGTLYIASRGAEEVLVFCPTARDTVTHEATSVVYELEESLHEWKSIVPAGQYVFPFTLKVPDYAPASFYFSGEDTRGNFLKSQIYYTISCKLTVLAVENKPLSHSRMLVMRNKHTQTRPSRSLQQTEAISGCCCTGKGTSSIRLSTSSETHPQIDGSLKYKLDPDNTQCEAPINHVVGSVLLNLEFTLPSAVYKATRTLSSTPRATWISAHTSVIYERDFEYTSDLKMHREELNPSSNCTPLISCVYQIEAFVYYDVFCKGEPICVRMPVHVDPKDTFLRESPLIPRSWDPDEFLIHSFSIQNLRMSTGEMPTNSFPNL